MAEALKLERISYSYPLPGREEAPALYDIDLAVEPGSVLCIGGSNGSGKSTLAQVCAGLLAPTAGSVLYGGRGVEGRSGLREHRRKVGLLFQSPEDQLFADTVTKDIAFGPSNHGVRGEELKKRVTDAAEMVGLPLADFSDRSPFSLSEGEKRRVALAGVFAMNPEVLVLDEPFIGLDYDGRERLRKSLSVYRERLGASVIIVTHELADAWRIADRFALLDAGRMLGVEDKNDLVSGKTDLAALGIKLPQWVALARELKRMGISVEEPSDPGALARALASCREVEGGR